MSAPKLHDTLTRQPQELFASNGETFRFYCCGPTVYGPAHIGNFRTFIVQDVLHRILKLAGLNPMHVRNLTDVDDKTIRQSQAEGESLRAFTDKWTKKFHDDCAALNLLPPHKEPRATDHIPQQIALVEQLIQRDHAYVGGDGSVYFRVNSFDEYGKLANLDREALRTQNTNSAGEANDADEYDREQIADFALWKAWKPEDGDNKWDSPWGAGRPGWHLECSAMSREYLGDDFDLHGGGVDLTFPHHENEIAQSECACGSRFVRHWFHSAHLMVEGEKMSKSLGNLYRLDELVEKGYTPMEVRYALLSGHYRQPLNFTFNGLNAARSAIEKLEKLTRKLLAHAGLSEADFATMQNDESAWDVPACPALAKARARLWDDLNVPGALGEVFSLAKEADSDAAKANAKSWLEDLGKVLFALGITLFNKSAEAASDEIPEDIAALAEARWQAKKDKDFAKADTLRDELSSQGWLVKDSKDGYEITKK